jgi:phosphoadenosine phosphosulfate reductase
MGAMSPLALQANPSKNYDTKLVATKALLRDAINDAAEKDKASRIYPFRITQASSLGAEDVLITHLLVQLKDELQLQVFPVDVFVLNTEKLHRETREFAEQQESRTDITFRFFKPNFEQAIQFVNKNGELAMRESLELRKTCCHIRKVEPLGRALAGYSAWITGMRSEQSAARTDVPAVDNSDPKITKYNPLVDWTWGDVLHYIVTNNVPYNALHDQFYPSIGCEPCTRAVSLGEDFRAGRWWWENVDGVSAKECGLHVKALT